jgi:NADH-quinone oxidoreductase subunit J
MLVLFIIASDVALAATVLAVTTRVTLHALLYLAISLIAVAIVFWTLGAPFIAALEVIIYAGAVVVLFLFAVMLLAPGETRRVEAGRAWRRSWAGPAVLALVLLVEMAFIVFRSPAGSLQGKSIPPSGVGTAMMGTYAVGIELASMLLLVALVGVQHLGRGEQEGARFEAEPEDRVDGEEPQIVASLDEPLGEAPGRGTT